ncbi:hypothetical protein PX860_01060 [Agrobacterium leguminum]|uniref:hypothetical protein n=1 Tax=Agrobacterium TaxID=357 RepID=UPI00115DA982|nr:MULTISPECIES: hypothetical protein [Agrobacterium]WLD97114.1 hypothetical protein PX860_01060 [Agrobacterium leguminum]
MSDIALKNAETKKKQLVTRRIALHQEIAQLDEQIGKIDSFIQDWHLFAESLPELSTGQFTDSQALSTESPSPPARRTTGNSRKEDVADVAYEIIFEREHPVSRDELLNEVTQRGMVIEGKDRPGVFTTMMWRMRDRIVKLESGGYWLADVEYPPENYFPPQNIGFDDVLGSPASKSSDVFE